MTPSASTNSRTATSRRFGRLAAFGAAVGLSVLSVAPASMAQAATAEANPPAAIAKSSEPDVMVVIDNNRRLGEKLAIGKSAIRTYLNELPANTRVGLITFGDSTSVVRELGPVNAGLDKSLAGIVPEGSDKTPGMMFSAVVEAGQNLGTTSSRPSILLVSDGIDGGEAATFGDAASALSSANANIDILDLGANDAGKAVFAQFTANGGNVVAASELLEVKRLAVELASPPTQLGLSAPKSSGGILSSPIFMAFGALAVFGGLLVGGLSVLGPKEVKVDLIEAIRNPGGGAGSLSGKEKKKKQKTVVTGLADRLTDVADKQLAKSGRDRGLNAKLEMADWKMRSGEFLILATCVGLAFAAVGNVLYGKVAAGAGFAVGIVATLQLMSFKGKKRCKRFGDQLPDTLQLLASSLRAGQGLVQAVDSVAREAEAPTKEEFHRIVVETRLGRDLVDSMRSTATRLQSQDMEWVVPAVEINREVGGDLAEVLDQVGQTIRDRSDLRRQVKTLSAEGRLSAIILLALPFAIAGFIRMSNPEYMQPLFAGKGLYMLGAAGLAMVIGGFWLLKLCKIEF
jgi:tight adherence protein B